MHGRADLQIEPSLDKMRKDTMFFVVSFFMK